MIYDFHTHTIFSDGVNSPIELIRYAVSYGYGCIALTDHISYSNIDHVLDNVVKDCQLAQKYWNITAIPGAEITNVPAKSIDQMAEYAKEKGAKLVVVHGQSIVERVEPGTNWEAVNSSYVDILAHPGLITEREAQKAAINGIFLEISARKGHSLGNGRTAYWANQTGAKMLINTDSHSQADLFQEDFQQQVGMGAGLSQDQVQQIIKDNALALLKKIGIEDKLGR